MQFAINKSRIRKKSTSGRCQHFEKKYFLSVLYCWKKFGSFCAVFFVCWSEMLLLCCFNSLINVLDSFLQETITKIAIHPNKEGCTNTNKRVKQVPLNSETNDVTRLFFEVKNPNSASDKFQIFYQICLSYSLYIFKIK